MMHTACTVTMTIQEDVDMGPTEVSQHHYWQRIEAGWSVNENEIETNIWQYGNRFRVSICVSTVTSFTIFQLIL